MTSYLTYLIQGIALGISAAAAPGAFQAFLINQTLSGSWRRGAAVAFAPLLSDPPIVIGMLFLLEQLPPSFIRFVKLAGGVFAIYMALSLLKAYTTRAKNNTATKTPAALQDKPATARTSLTRGALMNLLSPGPYTFWGTVLGPILLEAMGQSGVTGASFLAGFYGAFIGSLLLLVSLFHQAKRFGQRVVRYLTLASILILGIFGILLVASGI